MLSVVAPAAYWSSGLVRASRAGAPAASWSTGGREAGGRDADAPAAGAPSNQSRTCTELTETIGKIETAVEEDARKENGREIDGAVPSRRRTGEATRAAPLRSPTREVLERTEYIQMSSPTPRH
jgi:hypothetical protein